MKDVEFSNNCRHILKELYSQYVAGDYADLTIDKNSIMFLIHNEEKAEKILTKLIDEWCIEPLESSGYTLTGWGKRVAADEETLENVL